jgi:parallel beta-helix repeat protein
MAASDTLILMDGTYTEAIRGIIPSGPNAGAPTILQAQTRNAAILLPNDAGRNVIVFNTGSNFITIDGIDIDGSLNIDSPVSGFASGGSNFVTIKNSKIHGHVNPTSEHASSSCIISFGNSTFTNNDVYGCHAPDAAGFDQADHGFYICGGNTVENNRIRDNGGHGIQAYQGGSSCDGNTIRNNVIYSNNAAGILISGNSDIIYNNVIYGNGTVYSYGHGIYLYGGGSGNQIYNNSIYNNKYCIAIDSYSATKFQNNICLSNTSGAISDGGSGTTCTNNLNVAGCVGFQGTSNPFVSANTGDFRLATNINGALDLTNLGITTDITGATRFMPPDMGAYEFLSLSVRYIATTGSDSNSCDASKVSTTPKQNFTGANGAIACMGGADVLVVASGTYAESLIDIIPGGVTIRATTANGPIIRPASGTNVINLTHDGIVLDGLDIDGVNVSGSALTGAITGGGAVSSAIIKNGTIRNGGNSCAVNFAASTFTNNDVYDCGYDGIQVRSSSTVEGNRVRGTGDIGIIAYQSGSSSDNNTIRNNVVYDNAAAGILLSGTNNTAYNNISYINGTGIIFYSGGTANRSYNNTFYNNTGWCVNVDTGQQSTQIVNNICLSNQLGAILDNGSLTTCTNNMNVTGCQMLQGTQNPFQSAGGANFRLTSDDNMGTFLPAVLFDIDNVARSNPPDRGVYEFVGIGVTAGTSIFDVRGMR